MRGRWKAVRRFASRTVLGLAAAAVGATLGCGRPGSFASVDDAVEQLAGVYEVDGYAVNTEGCDQEGPPALDSLGDRRFVVYGAETLGQTRLGVMSCRQLADCRELERRHGSGDLVSGEYGYQFTTVDRDGRLTAVYSSSGFASEDRTTCTGGTAADRTLERLDGAGGGAGAVRLRLEERTRKARDFPAEDGGCGTGPALAAAEGQPCTRRLTLTATAVK